MTEPNPDVPETKPAFSMDSYMKPSRFPAWIAPAALLLGVVGTVLSLWAIKSASDNAPGVNSPTAARMVPTEDTVR